MTASVPGVVVVIAYGEHRRLDTPVPADGLVHDARLPGEFPVVVTVDGGVQEVAAPSAPLVGRSAVAGGGFPHGSRGRWHGADGTSGGGCVLGRSRLPRPQVPVALANRYSCARPFTWGDPAGNLPDTTSRTSEGRVRGNGPALVPNTCLRGAEMVNASSCSRTPKEATQ